MEAFDLIPQYLGWFKVAALMLVGMIFIYLGAMATGWTRWILFLVGAGFICYGIFILSNKSGETPKPAQEQAAPSPKMPSQLPPNIASPQPSSSSPK
ncbi:hypothetical protein [Curvibacter delicatus]|uniref:hypothetical protein n=1 Tax=Curvibacter delicatus TaxID=80879 RepID=UPI0012ED9046|nr:hypothetical protein [Curvibacter delicatus]